MAWLSFRRETVPGTPPIASKRERMNRLEENGYTSSSMPTPSVSVLLPVRDAAPWLDDCLASLARQTLVDFEVVAVDDGSVDDSGAILDRWAARDRRFSVVHQPPRGLVPALNRGLDHCRGELVARMDADDVSHPRRLELQTGLLAALPGIGVVSCLVRHFPSRVVAEGFRLYEEWLNSLADHGGMARERFIESPLAHPSAMVRREVLEAAGGWHDTGWPEDYDLWLRLFEAGVGFAKVARPLFFWREHGDRLTRTDERYSVPSFLRCKAHYLARGPLAETDGIILWGAGQTGRRLSKALRDEGVKIELVVDIDPSKIGRTLRGVPIIGPDELGDHLDPETVILAAVASRGARDLIRTRLVDVGLAEGDSFWCVA
jgi:GT2 family glycosyltransferase